MNVVADEIEKILVGAACGVLVAFAAWLRRKYELRAMGRVPCSCPRCGHVHFIIDPKGLSNQGGTGNAGSSGV